MNSRIPWCKLCKKDAPLVGVLLADMGGLKMRVSCHGQDEIRFITKRDFARGGMRELEDRFNDTVFIFLSHPRPQKLVPVKRPEWIREKEAEKLKRRWPLILDGVVVRAAPKGRKFNGVKLVHAPPDPVPAGGVSLD